LKELEEYLKKNTDKFEQFCNKYQETLVETEKQSGPKGQGDARTKSYYVFLDSIGLHEMMIAEVVRDTYNSIFGRGIEKDVGMGMYDKIQDRIGREMVVEATRLALDESITKPYREEHQAFQKVSQYYEIGLTALIEKKYLEAIRGLAFALQSDKQLEHTQVRRTEEISKVLQICTLSMLEEANKKILPQMKPMRH